MRIGILTLPLHTNYGGILQAYALQTVLERMGHEVVVYNLNRKPTYLSLPKLVSTFAYRIAASIKNLCILNYYNANKEATERYAEFQTKTQYTQLFVDKYIHSYYLRDHAAEISQSKVDCAVVGSDQIWDVENGSSISHNVVNAYLPFLTDNVKRFSYAASFGHDSWRYSANQTAKVRECIKRFSGISVRESSGITLCKENLHVEAQVHLDPTMLLSSEDYVKNLHIADVEPSKGDLLLYILDRTPEKDAIAKYIEDSLCLKHFRVNSKAEDVNNKSASLEDKIQPPVEKWLRGFMDAKFVVTDSFHACVFSILFHKPFIVIGNKERGLTRFTSLLSTFALENRLVSTLDNVRNIPLTDSLDWEFAEKTLQNERKRSFEYIEKELSL